MNKKGRYGYGTQGGDSGEDFWLGLKTIFWFVVIMAILTLMFL